MAGGTHRHGDRLAPYTDLERLLRGDAVGLLFAAGKPAHVDPDRRVGCGQRLGVVVPYRRQPRTHPRDNAPGAASLTPGWVGGGGWGPAGSVATLGALLRVDFAPKA